MFVAIFYDILDNSTGRKGNPYRRRWQWFSVAAPPFSPPPSSDPYYLLRKSQQNGSCT
jgi:hypothetical protein